MGNDVSQSSREENNKNFSQNEKVAPPHQYSHSEGALERDDYGWFEEIDLPGPRSLSNEISLHPLQRALSLPASATETPLYVLESSLETQQLWYRTAGLRPKQPKLEREKFEKLWRLNFEKSCVQYDSTIRPHGLSNVADCIPPSETHGRILFRGKSPFSNSMSRSFVDGPIAAMTLQMPYFRVNSTSTSDEFAEFLIVISVSSRTSPITFGIWRRFSDFARLANVVTKHSSENIDEFRNASLSWKCVMQRKRWIKCLDKDYLALKCFLLERFVQDVLFECSNATLLVQFLGLDLEQEQWTLNANTRSCLL
jgi:hypothetical protein